MARPGPCWRPEISAGTPAPTGTMQGGNLGLAQVLTAGAAALGPSLHASAATTLPCGSLGEVSPTEIEESEAELAPQDAPSTASTRAPGDLPAAISGTGVHGRARGPARHRLGTCGCPCRDTSHFDLGPCGPTARRCGCPMCGHQSIDGGQGCYHWVRVSRSTRGTLLCPHCSGFCLRVLGWADSYYEQNYP